MDKRLVVAGILVIIGAVAILYNFTGNSKESSDEDLIKVSYGNVQVTAMFLNPKYPDLTRPTFYLRFDTHSGDLYVYDILNATFLEVGSKKYKALTWKEDERSWGHHRMGIIEFPQEALNDIKSEKRFKLVIEGVEGTRVLEWEI